MSPFRNTAVHAAALLVLLGGSAGCATSPPASSGSAATDAGSSASDPDRPGREEPGGAKGTGTDAGADCPATAKLDNAPERVVTLDAGAAAFLVALGLEDRIVGTAATEFKADFSGALREKLDALPVLSRTTADKETVIAAEPELVTGISRYELGSFDGTPTQEQLARNGIAAMVACDTAKGVSTGIDATYRYIAHLAEVFRVPGKGKSLIAEMRREAAAGTAPARHAGSDEVPVLSLSAAPTGGAGIHTSGGSSFANGVITMAGGRNVAASTLADFATLSAEEVTRSNPEVILAVTGFSRQSGRQLIAAIKSSPLLADTDAVKNDHVIAIPQSILLSPSVLSAQAVRTVAEAVEKASS
ncbi:ABC transporter substrate-binding protein [Streptomyces flavofungini]|uniref:ABC transporter substrate-binding protein n=1 Tax=Streptomyces flavofungini TaxID=68200 RepID=UPI0034DE1159